MPAWLALFAAGGVMVGVLEQPQCHPDQPRQVRALFQKYPDGWVALPERGNGGPIRFLGIDLTLVDSGDYDGDGPSELVLWFSGYNKNGYVLFGDELGAPVNYWWWYH